MAFVPLFVYAAGSGLCRFYFTTLTDLPATLTM